jgi:hypothetical protein
LQNLSSPQGERPKAGDVALPKDIEERARQWAKDESEREKEREAFMGKLQAVGKDPRAAVEEIGG